MSWDTLFSIANLWALICWIMLIFLPRSEFLKTAIFYLGIGLLSFTYGVLIILLLTGLVDGNGLPGVENGSFSSIEGIRALFQSDGAVVIGWIHYLAFDLFVGLWISREADSKGFSRILQAPVLLLTFLAGPLGLFIWLVIREPAARRAAKRKKVNP